MHELYILKEVAEQQLLPAGYVLDAEKTYPDDFGSYYAIYSRGSHEVRFVWDGKDGWGFLEHRKRDSDTWEPIGSPISESNEAAMREKASLEWPEALAHVLV